MAANDERGRARELAWPPADDSSFDVFHLDPSATRQPSEAISPGRQVIASRSGNEFDLPEDNVAATTEARGTTTAKQPSRAPGPGSFPSIRSRAERVQRDEPARSDQTQRRGWRAAALVSPVRWLRRPGWLTPERAGIVALALITIGEASFIAARMIRSNTPSAVSTRNTQPRPTPPPNPTPPPKTSAAPDTTAGAVGTSGRLVVDTSPSGGGVAVDGRDVGTAPVSLTDVEQGDHTVVVKGRHSAFSQRVHIAAGRETQLLVPLRAAAAPTPPAPRVSAPADGWVRVSAPIEVRVYEGDTLLGTSEMAQIDLPAGRHSLVFANDAIGYRATQAVVITAGKASEVTVDLPKQTLAINALPWADVWIDGVHVGETPIGRATVAVGRHTVLLRNPEFGERTVTAVVTTHEAARISVDMRK